MPVPAAIAPLAWTAARWAALGLAAYAVARIARGAEARPLKDEAALDAVPEGVSASWSRDAGRARADAAAGWSRVIRAGRDGPGVEIDAAALARLRVRVVPARPRAARRAAR